MKEDNFYNNHLKKFIRLDLTKINFESFLGLGFESILVAVVAGVIFGFLIGAYPFFVSLLPILPSTNLILFIGFGVPLTGTTHYEPRLGILSSAVMLIVARYAQLLLGLAMFTQDFFILAGAWTIAQIFLIGYLPGKIIPTSESLGYLFRGLSKVTLLYAAAEYFVWTISKGTSLNAEVLLVFPAVSVLLLLIMELCLQTEEQHQN
jgi:hypothetical protein